jgi:F-type H+-transporting ATPase subunit delta
VTTATPLDEELRDQFTGMARKISGHLEVELTEKIDKNIIGGFILNVGDHQVDASVRKKLNILRTELRQNPYVKEF